MPQHTEGNAAKRTESKHSYDTELTHKHKSTHTNDESCGGNHQHTRRIGQRYARGVGADEARKLPPVDEFLDQRTPIVVDHFHRLLTQLLGVGGARLDRNAHAVVAATYGR